MADYAGVSTYVGASGIVAATTGGPAVLERLGRGERWVAVLLVVTVLAMATAQYL